jgi:hypothetical protein
MLQCWWVRHDALLVLLDCSTYVEVNSQLWLRLDYMAQQLLPVC